MWSLGRSGNIRRKRTHLFEAQFEALTELQQLDFTFRRLVLVSTDGSVFARIDRAQVNLHPNGTESHWWTAGVLGPLARNEVPNDHRVARGFGEPYPRAIQVGSRGMHRGWHNGGMTSAIGA